MHIEIIVTTEMRQHRLIERERWHNLVEFLRHYKRCLFLGG